VYFWIAPVSLVYPSDDYVQCPSGPRSLKNSCSAVFPLYQLAVVVLAGPLMRILKCGDTTLHHVTRTTSAQHFTTSQGDHISTHFTTAQGPHQHYTSTQHKDHISTTLHHITGGPHQHTLHHSTGTTSALHFNTAQGPHQHNTSLHHRGTTSAQHFNTVQGPHQHSTSPHHRDYFSTTLHHVTGTTSAQYFTTSQ
jgi:hypothetical protein